MGDLKIDPIKLKQFEEYQKLNPVNNNKPPENIFNTNANPAEQDYSQIYADYLPKGEELDFSFLNNQNSYINEGKNSSNTPETTKNASINPYANEDILKKMMEELK